VSKVLSHLEPTSVGGQGCQMAYFENKNPTLGTLWRDLQLKMLVSFSNLVYFSAIWSVFQPFGIFCEHFGILYSYLVCFSRFGMLYIEKSGNPVVG
jgi:hypothetical protein